MEEGIKKILMQNCRLNVRSKTEKVEIWKMYDTEEIGVAQ